MSTRPPVLIVLCCLLVTSVSACASTMGGPSLQPRLGEQIDPRLPVEDRSAELPPSGELLARIAAVRERAEAAAATAETAIDAVAQAVARAGAPESESWIAAQQLVSAAISERAPFTAALGDLDALLAARVRAGGRLVSRDLRAHQDASEALASIDRRQRSRLDQFVGQLGR